MIELLFFILVILYIFNELHKSVYKENTINKEFKEKINKQLFYANKLYKEKKYLASEKVYLQILKNDPKNINSYNHLGMIYIALKNYDKAIDCFKVVCRTDASDASYFYLGLAYYKNENYIKSISSMEKSIVFKKNLQAYIYLAKSYQNIDNNVKACELLEKVIDIEPSHKNLIMLADCYRKQGNKNKVEEIYGRIRNLNIHR